MENNKPINYFKYQTPRERKIFILSILLGLVILVYALYELSNGLDINFLFMYFIPVFIFLSMAMKQNLNAASRYRISNPNLKLSQAQLQQIKLMENMSKPYGGGAGSLVKYLAFIIALSIFALIARYFLVNQINALLAK